MNGLKRRVYVANRAEIRAIGWNYIACKFLNPTNKTANNNL